ncbi:hypothetical protein A3B21_05370 [Candidatus Uhrbacteria bacterium RIFCSPLOWO2_01_FULL_47_24]|uniref:Transposase IS200-like domain-containing protein n=1 Tax=Candidatus Uhrbacteria bacterium RIFCSPLOWO2_01_FULL_47_24 TaxID=1802401 RepID=A0A1F7UV19_9BACT|nr:MAG: hypothetical protein A2753_01310 [Candidatus Uhrbacteria bacterium RIFCSPHIGHO2_01_FULL_47_11]OGL67516.1 MAG: hypothetical protein A3D58_01685 [Candidatus Uhrbacteria bacterium RIFCSPHIGHO2_02_FULL_46_47]OGL82109.1 MAG: hypothetical protein A3B21_05370 [Candidatus Uhrbacteria bacterium RIFCSPLOWO2_01_FULL_47_24]OGL83877.1 MAG: hypothetical protein A3J03_01970 [Candidatus Uhrbacteria bacterium RIFCSPLOWO2_02_FULL_46_25]OGL91882.1 MAG: hypothetical protein A3H11_01820 [Candidatus Uhrbacte
MVKEKPHRLDPALYRGHRAVAFTCCIEERKTYFTNNDTFLPIKELLIDSLQKYATDAHVYLFMPDHLHVLLEGKQEHSNLYECVVNFKQRSGFWFSKNIGARWQKDFYDHVLRADEEIEKHVRYILENPVRKGITNDWKSYPYKGSTIYDFSTW